MDGVITMDNTSFTTRVNLHCGSTATTLSPCINMLNRAFLSTFISKATWKKPIQHGSALTSYERYAELRLWGGIGEPVPLQTLAYVRLSVQFFHGDEPTASLAIWAHFVPDGVPCTIPPCSEKTHGYVTTGARIKYGHLDSRMCIF